MYSWLNNQEVTAVSRATGTAPQKKRAPRVPDNGQRSAQINFDYLVSALESRLWTSLARRQGLGGQVV